MNARSDKAMALPVSLQNGAPTAATVEPFLGHRAERLRAIPDRSVALRTTAPHGNRTSRQTDAEGLATERIAATVQPPAADGAHRRSRDAAAAPALRAVTTETAGGRTDTQTGCDARNDEHDRRRRFEALVAVHLDDLYRFAYWLSGDRTVADDVVQEALIRAWRSIDRLKERKAAKGWLLTIVRRENARHFERAPLQRAETPADELAAERTEYDTSTEAFVLRRALDRLPPEYREPLLMQVVYGYSQREIAEHLGISDAGAGTRLFRAREKMRGLL